MLFSEVYLILSNFASFTFGLKVDRGVEVITFKMHINVVLI